MSQSLSLLRRSARGPAGRASIPPGRAECCTPAGDVRAVGRTSRNLLLAGLAAVSLALSACGGAGGGKAPPAGGEPVQPPPQPPPVDGGGITPEREVVIGFPGLLGGTPDEERIAGEEAAKVMAMHARGGTGAGQIVGAIEAGAHLDHPDLEGRFAYKCAMGLCNGTMGSDDDGRPELDRDDHSPLHDMDGHGTNVNGVIAAKRNGIGVYGVAYEARIASFGHDAPYPWDDGCRDPYEDCNGLGHAWGRIFDRQLARGVDWMRSLGIGATNNSWTRFLQWSEQEGFTASGLRTVMPESLTAFEAYVASGGVMVWGAGNGDSPHPSVESVLPRYFPELEKGWLAVAGLGHLDGRIGEYSWHCGVAAAWCLAAPGEVVTTYRNGLWGFAGGTSIAAPYVTAGLAGLKSMFPNLSYQQLRARVLATADRSFPGYSESVYGQGRLDLDAASRPVGGTVFALGARDTGAAVSTAGARAVLPEGAIARYLAGRTVTVLDGWQRAPFEVGLDAFAEARGTPWLSMEDLALAPGRELREERDGRASMAVSGAGFQGQILVEGRSLMGFGRGAGVAQGLADLAGAPLAARGYRMSRDAAGIVLGFSDSAGEWHGLAVSGGAGPGSPGFGTAGWNPEAVLAVSFAPGRAGEAAGAEAFGVSLASTLDRPMGWEGSGALEMGGDSVELAWRRSIANAGSVRLDATSRLTHLALQSGPLLRFRDALLASVDLEASFRPHRLVTVAARLGTERPVSAAGGRIRAAAGVDEGGAVSYRDVTIDGRDLLSFDRAGLSVLVADGSNASFGLGVAAVRDGFGRTEALAGMRMGLEF